MTVTLALREETWTELTETLNEKRETAGFLLAGLAAGDNDITLLGRSIRWVPEDAYLVRTTRRLSIASGGFVPALKAAHGDNAIPIFIHTHPSMGATPSPCDDVVDRDLRAPALLRSGQPFYASLILGGTDANPHFTGRLYDADGHVSSIDRVRVIGRRIRVLPTHGADDSDVADAFDRHIRAFGRDGQQLISRLRIGVVGLGGTGSAVAEQLTRLGVKHITLIDNDSVSDTNLTRIHESQHADIGKPKVEVAAEAIRGVGLGASVDVIDGRVTEESYARRLRHLDVVFACTDDEAGRAVLSRLAIWYLIPTIDMGFVIDPDEAGTIRGLYGRVTTLLPGSACLLCRQHITPAGIRNDMLPDGERERRAAEGYAPGLGDPDPAVGTFTTLTAMFAVTALLERLIGYSPDAGGATELNIRLHELDLSRNSRPATPNHFCGDANKWGRGDTQPLLETAW
jgi:molybdopterin/thiamine biosynthesis adenylyltransferase